MGYRVEEYLNGKFHAGVDRADADSARASFASWLSGRIEDGWKRAGGFTFTEVGGPGEVAYLTREGNRIALSIKPPQVEY